MIPFAWIHSPLRSLKTILGRRGLLSQILHSLAAHPMDTVSYTSVATILHLSPAHAGWEWGGRPPSPSNSECTGQPDNVGAVEGTDESVCQSIRAPVLLRINGYSRAALIVRRNPCFNRSM